MRILKSTGFLGAVTIALGCAPAADDGRGGRGPGGKADDWEQSFVAGGAIPYILGFTEEYGQKTGGSHQLMIPSEDGREPIDDANKPSRLHPDLRGTYMRWDTTITGGTADWPIFASGWWPQSQNGISDRWNSSNSNYEDLTGDADNLSPSEKYDLLFNPGQQRTVPETSNWSWAEMQRPVSERGPKTVHPRIRVAGPATEWELRNHGNYQNVMPDSWWGHCNGWASYATTETGGAPKRDVRVKRQGNQVVECAAGETGCVFFRMADIEALMSEVYFSDAATFSGRRCNTDPDQIERDQFGRPVDRACRDINAGTMHVAMTGLLAKGAKQLGTTSTVQKKLPFIIDHNWDWEVWNFPVKSFAIDTQEEIDEAQAAQLVCGNPNVTCNDGSYIWNENATRFARVSARYTMISDGVSGSELLKQADTRNVAPHVVELHYVLELDGAGNVLGGEWIQQPGTTWGDNSKELHPDFLWIAINYKGAGEDSDDLGGSDDNPYISYKNVKALLVLASSNGGGGGGGGGGSANICADNCGEQVSVGGASCWCDDQCTMYGDCCQDGSGGQGSSHSYVDQACGN